MSTAAGILWRHEMDSIFINEILIRCILGINPEERIEKQDVLISLKIKTDLKPAGMSDDFHDTIDYRALKKSIVEMAENSEFYLVEALAEKVSDIVLQDERVHEVKVKVEKPTALRYAKSVGVKIKRGKGS